MPDQDWADKKAQDIYVGTHGDCCCDRHAQDDVRMIAEALREAYQKGHAEGVETACRAVCSMCADGMAVESAYRHDYWHGNEDGQRCQATHIRRTAAEKEESRELG